MKIRNAAFKTFSLIFLILSCLHSQQTKAIWVVRDALTGQKMLSVVDIAKKLKCNKIFLQLRALGRVYYPTKLDIPKAPVNEIEFNELIEYAKKCNIEVHAWLNYSYVGTEKNSQYPENHVLNFSENSIISSPVNGLKSEGYFLHPNDEKNLSEVKNIIKELIEKYNIEGVHLDYFRYPKDLSHSSNTGRTRFLINYGLDPNIPIIDPGTFIKRRGLEAFKYFKESYSNFLRNELTGSLIEISEIIKDKNIQLSVAVKPNPLKAKHQYYQDWPIWIKNGLCDFVIIMNYNPSIEIFNNNLKLVKQSVNESKVVVGIATYNITKNLIVERLNIIKESKYKGFSIFSYNNLLKNNEIFNYVKNAL